MPAAIQSRATATTMTISDNILNLRRGLIVLAIIFPVLYFVFAGVSVVQDYQTTMGKAESDVRNAAASSTDSDTGMYPLSGSWAAV